MSLWDQIRVWLHRPFQEPMDPVNWLLLLLLSASIAWGWSRVLDKVLEE